MEVEQENTILIIDDDPEFSKVVSMSLEFGGYHVAIRHSAAELSALLDNDQPTVPQSFDLILLDLTMPGVRGEEIYNRLRIHPKTAMTPIIILSAVSDLAKRVELLQAGAQDYIVKPFNITELLSRVAMHIALSQARKEQKIAEKLAQDRHQQAETLLAQKSDLLRELRLSQEKLVQNAKMAAAGRLAASLAHEINNPLQSIHSCLQLAIHFNLSPEKQAEYLQMADEEVERVVDIVGRILEFSRPSQGTYQMTRVNRIVNQVIQLSGKYMAHRNLGLQQFLASDIPSILVIPDQIAQALLNIILNAVDAMGETGTLIIRSHMQGDWIIISVEDSGSGIPAAVQSHIFEPFFTTKEKNSGLGLTIAYGIVERHGGMIEFSTEQNRGTTFRLFLPRQPESAIDWPILQQEVS
jgi:signal transduction histidine kinase